MPLILGHHFLSNPLSVDFWLNWNVETSQKVTSEHSCESRNLSFVHIFLVLQDLRLCSPILSSLFGFHDFVLSLAFFPFIFYSLSTPLPSHPLLSPLPKGEVQLRFNFPLSFLHLYPSFQSKFEFKLYPFCSPVPCNQWPTKFLLCSPQVI